MVTKILYVIPPLLKFCTDQLTEGNNRGFRGVSALISLFSFFSFFGQRGISSTNWRWELEFCKGLPHWAFFLVSLVGMVSALFPEGNNQYFVRGYPTELSLFFSFFGKQDQVATRQSGMWIDFRFSELLFFLEFSCQTQFQLQNCVIFQDFSVGIFRRHPGQCGTLQGLTGLWF